MQLVCTAVAVEPHEQPFWYKEHANGSMTPCSRQEYIINNSFEMSACRWTTVLTIPHLSQENTGTYHCRLGYNFDNFTLYLNGMLRAKVSVSLYPIVTCTLLLIINPNIIRCCSRPIVTHDI